MTEMGISKQMIFPRQSEVSCLTFIRYLKNNTFAMYQNSGDLKTRVKGLKKKIKIAEKL